MSKQIRMVEKTVNNSVMSRQIRMVEKKTVNNSVMSKQIRMVEKKTVNNSVISKQIRMVEKKTVNNSVISKQIRMVEPRSLLAIHAFPPGADLLIVEESKGGLSSILGLDEEQLVLLHLVQDALQQMRYTC